jgi:hypothetical protein
VLLTAVYAEPKDSALRLVWLQNFVTVNESFRWRTNDETPPTGKYIGSPYDVDARYVGQAKTRLAHLIAAAVINIVRLLRWLAGEPKVQTRPSPFARLYQAAT